MKRLLIDCALLAGIVLLTYTASPTFAADTAPATPVTATQPAVTPSTPAATPTATVTEAPSTVVKDTPVATGEVPETTPGEILKDAETVYDNWTKIGWLAGLVALINLLLNLTKFGPVKEWFTVNKKKWLMPYIAAGLGAIAGGLLAYQMKTPMPQGIIEGLIAGLGAVGGHEFLTKLRPSKRTA